MQTFPGEERPWGPGFFLVLGAAGAISWAALILAAWGLVELASAI